MGHVANSIVIVIVVLVLVLLVVVGGGGFPLLRGWRLLPIMKVGAGEVVIILIIIDGYVKIVNVTECDIVGT